MKAIKFIFAILLFSNVVISCSADSSEDDELYAIEQQVQATGEETSSALDNSRN